jgi:bifunctional non-homologous end joining protein LigD
MEIREIEIAGFEEPYLYLENRAGLVALVQIGALEIHPWGCRTDRPDRPDRLIFDLDPGEGVAFGVIVEAALDMRERLDSIGIESAVKTTGGKGLHVVVPIERRYAWPEVKAFARAFAEGTAAAAPERYLTRLPKAERRGRIFIDYLRNDPTSTAVAAYSTRNRPGAPVSAPLHWSELTPNLDPAAFSLATMPDRARAIGDPWANLARLRNRLPPPR